MSKLNSESNEFVMYIRQAGKRGGLRFTREEIPGICRMAAYA